MIFGFLAFPIKPKKNIQLVVIDSEDVIFDNAEAENKVEYGAECFQSGSIEGEASNAIHWVVFEDIFECCNFSSGFGVSNRSTKVLQYFVCQSFMLYIMQVLLLLNQKIIHIH